jgi:hypothetical protein
VGVGLGRGPERGAGGPGRLGHLRERADLDEWPASRRQSAGSGRQLHHLATAASCGGASARTSAAAPSTPTTQAAVSTETVAARPPTAAPSTPTTRAAVADEAATGVAPQRLTWQQLSPADKRLLNDVLHGRQPHSALGRLSPQQLEAALDYYQATGAAGRGTLPSELIRDFNQARVDFLRTGRGQPPGGVHDFAESWLQRQSPEWLEANRDAVNSLRQAIEKMRRRGGGG